MTTLPTAVPLIRRLRQILHAARPLILALLCGFMLTVLVVLWVSKQITREAQDSLGQITDLAVLQIESRIAAQSEVLRGLQGVFIANPALERSTFREILDTQNILNRLPGFIALSFARQIKKTDTGTFTAAVRNNQNGSHAAYMEYAVHPETGYSTAQPIEFLYPLNTSTLPLLGLDLLGLAENRDPISISRDDGRGITSPPMKLDDLSDSPIGFMMHYPVYLAGPKPQSVLERQIRYLGSISVIYRADHILSAIEPALLNRTERVRLYDTGGSLNRATRSPERLLTQSIKDNFTENSVLCSNRLINLPARQWRFEMCAKTEQTLPAHKDYLWLSWLIGCGLSLLLGIGLLLHKKSHALAAQLADDITANLRRHKTRHLKLEMLADEARDILVIRDVNGHIEYANPAAQHRFQQGDKLLEHSVEPLLVSAELSILNEPLITQCSHRSSNGDIHHYDAMLAPMRDSYGQYMGSAMLARDITQRIEQNDELRKTNERLSDLLELSSDWLWEQDIDARFTHVSGGFFKLHEINPAHMLGRSRWELEHAGVTEEEWEAHRKLIEAQKTYRDFIFTLHGGRETLVLSVSGKPVFDDSGYFTGYRGVGRDITALHQAKTLALNEKQRVLSTLESLSDGVITTDLAGHIDYMNPVAIALTGREFNEATGQQIEMIFQVIDPVTRLPLPSLPRQALANNHTPIRYRNAVLLNRFGLTFSIQEAIACILNEKGDIVGSVVVFRDLSDWIGQTKLMDISL